MPDDNDTPLSAETILMYPGNPDELGTLGYSRKQYKDDFEELSFVNREELLESLEQDLETRDLDLFQEIDEFRFKIPDYQRHYSWGQDDHQRLWYKLIQVVQLDHSAEANPPENFFGTIYVGELRERNQYEVIDGQQRLTTIAIVLECLRRKFEEIIPQLSGDMEDFAKHIKEDWIESLLLRSQGPAKIPFLQVSNHDNDFFDILFSDQDEDRLEMAYDLTGYDGRKKHASTLEEIIDKLDISEGAVNESDCIQDEHDITDSYIYFAESHQLLIEAFKYYEGQLDEFLSNEERFPDHRNRAYVLINITVFLLRSFRISEISFTGENNELRVNVFQELNDAGKPLTTKDKIKARIVSLFQQSDSYSVEEELDTWQDIAKRFADKSSRVEEFLVTYVQATLNPKSQKSARENLLDLFRLTDIGGHTFTPRLTSDSAGHEFLQELNRYSKRYVEIKDLSLEGGEYPLSESKRKRSEEILRRITTHDSPQWMPFVLYLYDDVSSTPGKDDFFQQVMENIESLIFRVSLSEVRTTVIEDTFMESAESFRELKDSEDNDEYNSEQVIRLVLENVEDDRQLSGETLVNTIVRSRAWGNDRAKQLFLKLVDEEFDDEQGMTRRDIEDESVDTEHVFPEGFIRGDTHDNYAWLSDFFPTNNTIIHNDSNIYELINVLESNDASNISEGEDTYDRIQRIVDHIKSDFVQDLGNMIILEGGLNRSVKNSRFAIKLRKYHEEYPGDLDNNVNNYFSTDNPDIREGDIKDLLDLEPPSGYDDTESTLGDVEEQFNGWWNIDRLAQRKTNIIQLILESLTYDIDENEYQNEFDQFLDDSDELRAAIESDLVKRTNQAL